MSHLTPFQVAQLHTAIKMTFTTPSFSIHKYGVERKNFTEEHFERVRGKFFYTKIARKYHAEDLPTFFLANALVRPKAWVGDLASQEAEDAFQEYKGRIASLTYAFTQDIKNLRRWCLDRDLGMDAILVGTDPPLLRAYYERRVIPETIPILHKVFNETLYDRMGAGITDTIQWPKARRFFEVYGPFLDIDVPKYRQIVKDNIT